MKHSDFPHVSVVMSTYERPQKLKRALASVAAQTYDDFEVVVIDDCSPSKDAVWATLEGANEVFEKRGVELWAYRLGENSGYQSLPQNRGVEKARGDYIAYLDDDNTWKPEHLATLVKAIEANFSTDLVYSRVCYHVEDDAARELLKKSFTVDKFPEGDCDGVEFDPNKLLIRNFVDTSTMLHSKGAFWRLVRESGYGWDESLRRFADWNFIWRWAVHGNTAKLVDKVTVNYMWHSKMLQLTRHAIETPICFNYAQYQALRRGDSAVSQSVS